MADSFDFCLLVGGEIETFPGISPIDRQAESPQQTREVLIEAKRLGSIALQDVRQSVSTLRSDPLHDRDLASIPWI